MFYPEIVLIFSQARRYDSRTTIFSPEGRLYQVSANLSSGTFWKFLAFVQVEYAMEAISHAGTCLGILSTDGILIAAEKRNVHKLLDDTVRKLTDQLLCFFLQAVEAK